MSFPSDAKKKFVQTRENQNQLDSFISDGAVRPYTSNKDPLCLQKNNMSEQEESEKDLITFLGKKSDPQRSQRARALIERAQRYQVSLPNTVY